MPTLHDLICFGFLPREVPPGFNSASFAAFAVATPQFLASPGAVPVTECTRHNLGRPGSLRRTLKIPNPTSYLALAREVEQSWAPLVLHFGQSQLSRSIPTMVPNSGRSLVPAVGAPRLPRLRLRIRRGKRYLLRADISQFYSSIYSHSIPWALHTRPVAKAQRNNQAMLGNRLDSRLRKLQSDQTVGIPIGPDCSLVIAEVLLSAVDSQLQGKGFGATNAYRYIDDFEASFDTLGQAERALGDLQALLASWELTPNPKKTWISELPEPIEENWAQQLLRFEIRSTQRQRADLVGFFSRCCELAKAHPTAAVFKYALGRLKRVQVHLNPNNWFTLQDIVLTRVSPFSEDSAGQVRDKRSLRAA